MKKLITDSKKLIILLIIPYLLIVFLGVVPIDYNLVAPGGINQVTDVIKIENQEGIYQNINTVYVYAPTRITIMEYLLAKLDQNFSVSKNSPYYIASHVDEQKAGKIQKDTSITNSLIVAYEAAHLIDSSITIDYVYHGQIIDMVYAYTDSDLQIGDIVIEVDGKAINSPSKLLEYTSPSIDTHPTYEVKVKRGNEIIQFTITKPKTTNKKGIPGFSNYEYYEIKHASPSYNIEPSKTSGPSGGLMQALSIYANLVKIDLSKGNIICGTGTLEKNDQDEWIVGQIGGAYQKVIASNRASADVFFVPDIEHQDNDNYADALRAYNSLKNPKMALVPVRTFSDALAYFEGI